MNRIRSRIGEALEPAPISIKSHPQDRGHRQQKLIVMTHCGQSSAAKVSRHVGCAMPPVSRIPISPTSDNSNDPQNVVDPFWSAFQLQHQTPTLTSPRNRLSRVAPPHDPHQQPPAITKGILRRLPDATKLHHGKSRAELPPLRRNVATTHVVLMKREDTPSRHTLSATSSRMKQIERREWWLWVFVVIITLLLTGGIASFALPLLRAETDNFYWIHIRQSVRGLLGLVLLFDIYSLYQRYQIHSVRRQLMARDELFRVITENAADMIAVVDENGNRIYNSPAYQKVLGYSPEELQRTSGLDQIHPDDRARVARAAEQARKSGQGDRMEYRMRHKDGTWRYLESTASVVHAAGDDLLLGIAQRLASSLRKDDTLARHPRDAANPSAIDDTVARLGGDEFTVVIEDIHDASDAIRVAARIQKVLAATPFLIGGHEVFASASVGIALSTSTHENAEDLLRDAGLAMYRAKAAGKARCEVFDTAMHASAVKRLGLETELRRGLERGEFRVHYQPIIRLSDSTIAGFEALVRWE